MIKTFFLCAGLLSNICSASNLDNASAEYHVQVSVNESLARAGLGEPDAEDLSIHVIDLQPIDMDIYHANVSVRYRDVSETIDIRMQRISAMKWDISVLD